MEAVLPASHESEDARVNAPDFDAWVAARGPALLRLGAVPVQRAQPRSGAARLDGWRRPQRWSGWAGTGRPPDGGGCADASGSPARWRGRRSHLSAAQHHGRPVKPVPDPPHVTVRGKRRLGADPRATVHLADAGLRDDEVVDGVGTSVRTVLDSARRLPLDEALAVADSALRAGAATQART